ncbi:hypothetical protein EQG49_04330 [Periweissella cryptocerci]|uniref:Uncharacterized protein n=1 Tax=Periweissella cryptocerci TaxID=2506420 RepID=A0A4P6YSW6_9LACO|nr:hypothetical protein [Periweissella cryptocerci]QBO35742.1 hypothetical protein EQG49_04330 [Periweissella cryptocerci]
MTVLSSGVFKINKWPKAIDIFKSSILFLSILIIEGSIIVLDKSMGPVLARVLLVSFIALPATYGLSYIPRKVSLEVCEDQVWLRMGKNRVILKSENFELKPIGHIDTPWGNMDFTIRFSNNGRNYVLVKSVKPVDGYTFSKEYEEFQEFHKKLFSLEKSFKNGRKDNES